MTAVLNILPDGTARFIWDDELGRVARELGAVNVTRASHVEWDASAGGWMADLSPVGGPNLGPFDDRAEALRREVAWLRDAGY